MASLYKGIDAQKVAEEISTLGEEVSPEQLVEMARNPNTESHRCFTWDNDIAAEKWRKQEARNVFCNLVIQQMETQKEDAVPIRVFHKNDNGGYKRAEFVFKVQDEYEKLLQCALAELRAFKRKYSTLSELEEILALID